MFVIACPVNWDIIRAMTARLINVEYILCTWGSLNTELLLLFSRDLMQVLIRKKNNGFTFSYITALIILYSGIFEFAEGDS